MSRLKRLFGDIYCFRISICDALSQLNAGAKGRYHLLQELEKLQHSSTKSCCLNHQKLQEAVPNVVITEKKNFNSEKSYIPGEFSEKVFPDIDFPDEPVSQCIVCSVV